MVKNLLAMREIHVQSLGQEDPLEEGMATHSSVLAWRIPWTEEPGGLQSTRSRRVRVTLRSVSRGGPGGGQAGGGGAGPGGSREAFWEGGAHKSMFESSGKEPAKRVSLNPQRGVKSSGLEETEGLALVGRRHPSSSV